MCPSETLYSSQTAPNAVILNVLAVYGSKSTGLLCRSYLNTQILDLPILMPANPLCLLEHKSEHSEPR